MQPSEDDKPTEYFRLWKKNTSKLFRIDDVYGSTLSFLLFPIPLTTGVLKTLSDIATRDPITQNEMDQLSQAINIFDEDDMRNLVKKIRVHTTKSDASCQLKENLIALSEIDEGLDIRQKMAVAISTEQKRRAKVWIDEHCTPESKAYISLTRVVKNEFSDRQAIWDNLKSDGKEIELENTIKLDVLNACKIHIMNFVSDPINNGKATQILILEHINDLYSGTSDSSFLLRAPNA